VIPQRVKLKGFLCYKEEQEISFDGNATLWMLSGLNGSGKSTIFDAVTYSVFGHHRGGGQQAHELINKDCDSLLVEFDFLLDCHAYRAKRTLRRNTRGGATGTQQIFRLHTGSNGNGQGSWVAVEGTGQKREFDAWVAENIGLNYDTFTSSVLLLQGKAEKLLDSKPEGRREVLASIVDLDRYERLHREADDHRKERELALKTLSSRLAALPPVAPEELAAVEERIAGAQGARDQARAEVERLQGLEYQARAWVELQRQVADARLRYEQARGLLGDATAIEKAVERLRELREVYPRIEEIVKQRGPMHEAELKTKELTRQKSSLTEQLAQRDSALKQAHEKRSLRKKQIEADESRQGELTGRLRQAAVQLEKLKLYEQQEGDLGRLRAELDRLPADAAGDVARAREEYDGLVTLSQVVPLLARFQARRDELRQALATEQAAQQRQQAVRVRGEQMAADLEKLRPQVEEAARALQQATDEVTKAKTLLQQARAGLKEITQLYGAKVCRHCGQALTPGHVQEEKRRRSAEVAEAEQLLQQATAAQGEARTTEQGLREQLAQADRTYQDARLEYRDCQNQMKQARADVERLVEECGQVYGEMPAPYRTRVSPTPPADWLATAYPTDDDVHAARSQASGVTGARRRLQHAEQVQQQWGNLKAQEASILQNLNRLQAELPADRQAVRSLHARLDNEEKALEKTLHTQRADLKEIEAELDRLNRERDQTRAHLADADTQLKRQEVVQQHAQQTIAKVRKSLPPAWQPHADAAGLRELNAWTQEKADLEGARTDERGKELQQARLNLDMLKEDVAALEAKQEGFPPEARLDPAAVQARLTEARKADRARDEELSQARQERALLESRLRQRLEIEEEYLATEKELAADRLLAELLGRDRLQLYLVRQAERQVVEYANAVLDRLSGGQLYLRLSGEANGEGSSAKALELEAYNRSTGEKPINVAFLSGSQKFRVAVSLALGIGQYASRQHRPIESVIIDEGFGCLDSQGRQVMIQELQNLRGQMRCILLVSHQEEFAEAFADGYHFQLESGATRVQRFQK
jgi:exonuclease SbcC